MSSIVQRIVWEIRKNLDPHYNDIYTRQAHASLKKYYNADYKIVKLPLKKSLLRVYDMSL